MDESRQELEAKLNEIEAEMKRIGYWTENPLDLQAQVAQGRIRHYLDAPSFELWLQGVFLPNARHAIVMDALPQDSQVGVIAVRQYDYHSVVTEAHGLMELLRQYDEMVGQYARERTVVRVVRSRVKRMAEWARRRRTRG